MKVMASGGELREFENRYICRDGSICWLQWNTRVRPAEGLVAAAARDVTDSVARKEQAVPASKAAKSATSPAHSWSTNSSKPASAGINDRPRKTLGWARPADLITDAAIRTA
jgi:predicted ATP-grasp superfamily ATP-dependent carboligase